MSPARWVAALPGLPEARRAAGAARGRRAGGRGQAAPACSAAGARGHGGRARGAPRDRGRRRDASSGAAFAPADLDGVWLVVAAATPEVNREVRGRGRRPRRVFVNAVDDPAAASAYLGGVVRRGGVTIAISTEGRAPALAGLLREALEAVIPDEVGAWVEEARASPRAAEGRGRADGPAPSAAARSAEPPLRGARAGGARMAGAIDAAIVSLVGAGPGRSRPAHRPRGRARWPQADLVLYDALVSPEAAGPRAARAAVLRRQARGPRRRCARRRSTR